MKKLKILFVFFFFIQLKQVNFVIAAETLQCKESETSGYIDSQLVPQEELSTLLDFAPKSSSAIRKLPKNSQSIKIYYEFVAPYQRNKPTLFVATGFYPWIVLKLFRERMPEFTDLYNVLQIHYRGSGCSTITDDVKPEYFNDIFLTFDMEQVRQKLQIEKWALWGSSHGSWLALNYTAIYPSRVSQLILRDTSLTVPTLFEASKNFENVLLPQLLRPAQIEILKSLDRDLELKNLFLKYTGTALMRRQRERDRIANVLLEAQDALNDQAARTRFFKEKLDELEPEQWVPAVTSNFCLGWKHIDKKHYSRLFIVEYVYKECEAFINKHPKAKIIPQPFYEGFKRFSMPVAIYQGYWDDYLLAPLTIDLQKKIPGSVLLVDNLAGHGEIYDKPKACFTGYTKDFLSGKAPLKLKVEAKQYCENFNFYP